MAAGSKCSNCGRTLSCGCQKRKASDGKNVCATCIDAYEASLTANKVKSK
jgi:hypothetical protein